MHSCKNLENVGMLLSRHGEMISKRSFGLWGLTSKKHSIQAKAKTIDLHFGENAFQGLLEHIQSTVYLRLGNYKWRNKANDAGASWNEK